MAKKKQTHKEYLFTFTKPHPHILGIIYLLIALLSLFAAFGFAGQIGDFVHYKINRAFLGYGFLLVPFLFLVLGYRSHTRTATSIREAIGMVMFVVASVGLLDILFSKEEILAGGWLGNIVGKNLVMGFDVYFSGFLLFGLTLIGVFMAFNPSFSWFHDMREKQKEKDAKRAEEKEAQAKRDEQIENAIMEDEDDEEEEEEVIKAPKKSILANIIKKKETSEEDMIMDDSAVFASSYTPPPLSLLGTSSGKPSTGDIKANANIIQRTLANFGIAVEMDEISIGPTVTRYAMKPAQGVRLSRIASLQNELALALAAQSIRIEAPIPGRSLVGVEVPNNIKSKIGLGSLLAENEFQSSAFPLFVSLGKGVSGKSHFTNIGKMPHALIAGATGAGKSVTIHNIILSLLYRNGPDMMRFIMVDPKRVEMTLYKKIPHLLTPVITDAKKAVLALKWAIKEMERRYDVLQKHSVRDISSYHATIVKPKHKDLSPEDIEEMAGTLPEKMPYIVIIIDELSDIMSAYPRELEAAIVRLAQMSRAVGIHLLLATQRPDVSVITGLIKANIPTRLALKVASQIDSRTILDARGAEKLLGYGDMLYKGEGSNEAIRVQCPYVSEDEVKRVVNYIQKNYEYELEDTISLPDEHLTDGTGGITLADGEDEDPMVEEAIAVVKESGKASTSYLQRRLSIGYSRAARIIDILEDRGIVGPANGSKPRDIIGATDDDDETYE